MVGLPVTYSTALLPQVIIDPILLHAPITLHCTLLLPFDIAYIYGSPHTFIDWTLHLLCNLHYRFLQTLLWDRCTTLLDIAVHCKFIPIYLVAHSYLGPCIVTYRVFAHGYGCVPDIYAHVWTYERTRGITLLTPHTAFYIHPVVTFHTPAGSVYQLFTPHCRLFPHGLRLYARVAGTLVATFDYSLFCVFTPRFLHYGCVVCYIYGCRTVAGARCTHTVSIDHQQPTYRHTHTRWFHVPVCSRFAIPLCLTHTRFAQRTTFHTRFLFPLLFCVVVLVWLPFVALRLVYTFAALIPTFTLHAATLTPFTRGFVG